MQEKTCDLEVFEFGKNQPCACAKGKNQIKREKMKMQIRDKIH